ncbi:MAG: hypothetical protein ACREP1_14630, partial [Rhodanobacteraceae bacterium]
MGISKAQPAALAFTVAALFALALAPGTARAADPGVARLSVLKGNVSIKRGDSGDTVAGAINAPLLPGDYLSTGGDSHAEVQFDYGNVLRAGPETQLRFVQLDAGGRVAQLAAGTVEMREFHDTNAHSEIDTPSVTIRPVTTGAFRITVMPDGNAEVTARSGVASIATSTASRNVAAGTTMVVTGDAANAEFQTSPTVALDDFDTWNSERDHLIASAGAGAYRYLNDDIAGAYDLDSYGQWIDEPGYGN